MRLPGNKGIYLTWSRSRYRICDVGHGLELFEHNKLSNLKYIICLSFNMTADPKVIEYIMDSSAGHKICNVHAAVVKISQKFKINSWHFNIYQLIFALSYA